MDTKFVTLIMGENPKPTQKAWVDAYNSLRTNSTQVSMFLNNREHSGTFIAGFEVYGMRIADFLEKVLRYTPHATAVGQQAKEELDSKKALIGPVVREVLLPLFDGGYHHLHDRGALFEFLISAIHLSDRSCLDLLATRLGGIPQLLGKIISEPRSSEFLLDWTNSLFQNPKSMQSWTVVAVDLAERCESDHGVSQEIDKWGLLEALRGYLDQAKHSFDTSRKDFFASSAYQDESNMRRLSIDEKKSDGTHRNPAAAPFSLSPKALPLLGSFGMRTPNSERTLLHVIEQAEKAETYNIMEAVMRTFPCRLCLLRGYGNSSDIPNSTAQPSTEQRLEDMDLDSFEGLLGSNLGIWKISLSAQAMKDLKHSKKEGNFYHIKEKLEALASGDWVRRSVAKPVSDDPGRFKVRVFQAWYGKNGRILWQVDVGFDEKHNSNCQIVRVWRIGDVKEIWASLDSVYRAQQTFSPTRIAGCKENLVNQNLKMPVVFINSEQDALEDYDPKTTDERTPQDMLISGKFHTLTSTVLDSVLHGQSRSDFPFDVTGKEVEIIKHFRTATFILGRSGTGKTSCLLYKLLSRYLVQNLVQSEKPIRQLLLTRSEPLARKLESEVQLLIDTQLLRVRAGFDIDTVDEGFETTHGARDGMDEETTEDLFSLQKEDFPLVCTFGHFLKRLENSIKANDRKNFTIPQSSTRQLVDFPVFQAAYWQQFPNRLRGDFEADLVFTEIMGVIKGAASLLTGLKPLSRDDYRSTSSRIAPTFAVEGERDKIYDIFEYYESKKKQHGGYDGIDRVKVVLSELSSNDLLKRRLEGLFEEVYVDEVQDQRPLEIELLLNLVQNPRGIHFAGDSAQCISKDSTFRFANVKALFYQHFSSNAITKYDPNLAKPELFSLARNFRSHQGILSLASFVMELLWKGFPDMVDKLPPEIGQYLGPKPVIFVGTDIIGLLQKASNPDKDEGEEKQDRSKDQEVKEPEGQVPELQKGTEKKQVKHRQVVIVRDQHIKDALEEKLDSNSLVFTIIQSKGMEYDDVFLFDFFSSSPYLSGYRSLEELLPPGANPLYGAAHMAMCSELKSLYVAITRPRNRLWILESNPTSILALFTTKSPKPLVDVKYFISEELPKLVKEVRSASATSAREWIETGEQCMERGIFDQALRCFKNAEDTTRILWAQASLAELQGRESRAVGRLVEFRSSFKDASRDFLSIGMKEKAASCLEALGEFSAAAEIWSEKGRHEKAAGLFEKGEIYDKAAEAYHRVGVTFKALQALYKGKLYSQLVCDLHKYNGQIEDGERKTYARECNILLRREKIPVELWDQTFDTFTSDAEKEEFLKEFQHKEELLKFYLSRGRIREAFKYTVKTGDFEEALEVILEKSGTANLADIDSEFQLSEVFKYAQTRKLLSSITSGSSLNHDERFSESSWSRPWADLAATANCYFSEGIKPVRDNIKEEWIKEYLDITISTRIEHFLKFSTSPITFPFEYLCGLSSILKNITENKTPLSKSTLLCLGVLPIPGESDSYLILAWSDLPIKPKASRTLNYGVVFEKAVEYISNKIKAAVYVIDQRARELDVNPSSVWECTTCVSRESWDNPEKIQSNAGVTCHDIPSPSQFSNTLEGLRKLCQFPDYLRESEIILSHWSDKLLNQLTYASSLMQDAEVIVTTLETFCTLESSTIIQRLRSIFLARTRPSEKGTELDFTALLDSYQLERILRLDKHDLNQLLHHRATKVLRKPETPPQDLAHIAFNRYERIHTQLQKNATQFSAGIFCESVHNLIQELEKLQKGKKCLAFYHGSVIAIYEDILTFLLFSIGTTEVMIPRSWTKLYLPCWENVLGATTDLERCCYQQLALKLIVNFCNIITDLEGLHKGKKSKATVNEVWIRRSLDLLVVGLFNIGTITPLPLRYEEFFAKVQKVFGYKGLKAGEVQNVQPNLLVGHIARAFQFYNQKDTILLYTHDGGVSKRVGSLDGMGIQLKKLPKRERLNPISSSGPRQSGSLPVPGPEPQQSGLGFSLGPQQSDSDPVPGSLPVPVPGPQQSGLGPALGPQQSDSDPVPGSLLAPGPGPLQSGLGPALGPQQSGSDPVPGSLLAPGPGPQQPGLGPALGPQQSDSDPAPRPGPQQSGLGPALGPQQSDSDPVPGSWPAPEPGPQQSGLGPALRPQQSGSDPVPGSWPAPAHGPRDSGSGPFSGPQKPGFGPAPGPPQSVPISTGQNLNPASNLPGSAPHGTQAVPARQQPPKAFLKPEGPVVHAAYLIQALRRRQLARRVRDKLYLETVIGRTIAQLQDFCASNRTEEQPRLSYMKFLKVMATDGLELYLLLDKASTALSAITALSEKMVPSELRTTEIQHYHDKIFCEYWYLFEDPVIFEDDAEMLENACNAGLKAIAELNGQLSVYMEKLQGEIEQAEEDAKVAKKKEEDAKAASKKKQKGKGKSGQGQVGNVLKGGEKEKVEKKVEEDGKVSSTKGKNKEDENIGKGKEKEETPRADGVKNKKNEGKDTGIKQEITKDGKGKVSEGKKGKEAEVVKSQEKGDEQKDETKNGLKVGDDKGGPAEKGPGSTSKAGPKGKTSEKGKAPTSGAPWTPPHNQRRNTKKGSRKK